MLFNFEGVFFGIFPDVKVPRHYLLGSWEWQRCREFQTL